MGGSLGDRTQNEDLEGEEIVRPRALPGRSPAASGSAGAREGRNEEKLNFVGDAIEEDDNDEAARYGPLTKHELEKYRK